MITSNAVATVVATHLKDVKNSKLANKPLRVLTDSGSDQNVINQKWTMYGKKGKQYTSMTCLTGAGEMTTKTNNQIKCKLDELSTSKEVTWNLHVDESNISDKSLGYDMIIGFDLMTELGTIINCKDKIVE